ncbi:hypothetical protein DSO57_1003154 [Entomophthora muscae]|uniref:Uncharacterized protein n=1 Tax=Entomophthora muscae TaxID=34485 RepID=A0ACC2RND8_9FUNG|nr:hypothetical protein DSO57_1003154 [Entomophthora muscae]
MLWLCFISVSLAHSWLDCIGVPKEYKGPVQFFTKQFYDEYCIGYGRGYPGRFNDNINDIYTVIVENQGRPDPKAALVCGPTQRTLNYTSEYPMTRVAAGTTVKLWYQMDNHLTPNTVFNIYSFGRPGREIATYADQLNAKKLMIYQFAGPETCLDIGKPNTWCWAYMNIPADSAPGVYSYLWNWPWNGNPIGEEYNTCFDIEVTR